MTLKPYLVIPVTNIEIPHSHYELSFVRYRLSNVFLLEKEGPLEWGPPFMISTNVHRADITQLDDEMNEHVKFDVGLRNRPHFFMLYLVF